MVVANLVNMFSPHRWPFLCLVSVFQRPYRLMFLSRVNPWTLLYNRKSCGGGDERSCELFQSLHPRSHYHVLRLSFRPDKSLQTSIVVQLLIENLDFYLLVKADMMESGANSRYRR